MSRAISLSFAVVVTSACCQMVRAQAPLQVTVGADAVWIRAGESPVLQYRYTNVPFKPYVKELYTPAGRNILLDAPPDHLHHHALMFAVAVDGVNYWEESPKAGRQEHGGLVDVTVAQRSESSQACFSECVHWIPPAGHSVVTERRTIAVVQDAKMRATVVTWCSKLTVPEGRPSVTLTGSHYFGLGLRFVRPMDGGEFFNADGKEGTIFRGEERLVRSNWCAYTATIDGEPVTVAMLGHPANPRHPTTWFTMAKPFAYLSGTLNLHEEPLSIDAGSPLVLRYAIVTWDGKIDADRVGEAYKWFMSDSSSASKAKEGATR